MDYLLYVWRQVDNVVLVDPRRRKVIVTTISSSNFANVPNNSHARNLLFMRIARQLGTNHISMGDIYLHIHLITGVAP